MFHINRKGVNDMTRGNYIGKIAVSAVFLVIVLCGIVGTSHAQVVGECPSKLMYTNPFSGEHYKGYVSDTHHLDASDALGLQSMGFSKSENSAVYIPFIHAAKLNNGDIKCKYGFDYVTFVELLYPKPADKNCFVVDDRTIQCVPDIKIDTQNLYKQ